ncbi:MAG TPA: PLD nuclease N-terminal domain-containing protein [Thermoleophilia bacterium]|nr:PLD nuclease N-terminal domain-containing protein [Thermoleophilia bacterium]
MTDLLATLPPLVAGPATLLADTTLPSTGTLALLGVVALVQLALLAAALVDLLRRPDEAVTGGRRWVWIIVVVLLQSIGPIAYFAAGHRPRPADDPAGARATTVPPAGGETRPAAPDPADRRPPAEAPVEGGVPAEAPAEGPAARVVDLLYGPAGDATSRRSPSDGEDGPPLGGAPPPERVDRD